MAFSIAFKSFYQNWKSLFSSLPVNYFTRWPTSWGRGILRSLTTCELCTAGWIDMFCTCIFEKVKQSSRNCSILPPRMGEHGVYSWSIEISELMELTLIQPGRALWWRKDRMEPGFDVGTDKDDFDLSSYMVIKWQLSIMKILLELMKIQMVATTTTVVMLIGWCMI